MLHISGGHFKIMFSINLLADHLELELVMISMQFLIIAKNCNHKNQDSKYCKNTNAFSSLERNKSYNGMESI